MSVDYSVHMGPFIKCKADQMITRERDIIACGNKKCQDFQGRIQIYDAKKNFCPSCGSPLENQVVEYEDDKIEANELQEGILKNALYETSGDIFGEHDNDQHIWVANKKREGFRTFGGDPRHDEMYLEIQELDTEKELEGFKRAFESEIQILKNEYGPDNVEVVWGIFNTAS